MSEDGNIVAFPTGPERSWRVIEAELCPFLYGLGADQQQVAHLCQVLQPIWERDPGVIVPASINGKEAVGRVNEWFSAVAVSLLMEIAGRELKLFNAGIE